MRSGEPGEDGPLQGHPRRLSYILLQSCDVNKGLLSTGNSGSLTEAGFEGPGQTAWEETYIELERNV